MHIVLSIIRLNPCQLKGTREKEAWHGCRPAVLLSRPAVSILRARLEANSSVAARYLAALWQAGTEGQRVACAAEYLSSSHLGGIVGLGLALSA